MRIAVASQGLDVSPHFGHCTNYSYYTVEDNQIINCQNMPAMGYLCGSIAPLMKELDVEVLIVGAMGSTTKKAFDKLDIMVVSGASGNALAAAEAYLANASEFMAAAQ